MMLNKGDIISLNQNKYIIIELLDYNNEKYAFTNKLKDIEEIGEDFYILKINGNNGNIITDEKLIETLLEKFKNMLNEDIDNLLERNN